MTDETTVSLEFQGKTVTTTLEEMEKAIDMSTGQFDGMPEKQAKIIHKVTGTYAEERSHQTPKVGHKEVIELDVAVDKVTKQRDKFGEVESVITWKAIE